MSESEKDSALKENIEKDPNDSYSIDKTVAHVILVLIVILMVVVSILITYMCFATPISSAEGRETNCNNKNIEQNCIVVMSDFNPASIISS